MLSSIFMQLFKYGALSHMFETNVNLNNTTVLHLTVNEIPCPVSGADFTHIIVQVFFLLL